MNSPKRHHFLPQFYLRYFTDPSGKIWEFDREKKKYENKGTRGSGWKSHYYSYKGKDGKRHTDIETGLLQKIEDKTKPVIDKINKRLSISDEERGILATFVSFQKTRVPEFEKTMNESTEKLIKSLNKRQFHSVEQTEKILDSLEKEHPEATEKVTPQEMYEFIQKGEYFVQAPREHSIKTMLSLAEHMTMYFVQMSWLLVYAPANSYFITSDNPFFILPPPNRDPNNFWDRGVGIITPGAKKVMPLSSQVCLVMGDHGEDVTVVDIDEKRLYDFNKTIATYSDTLVYCKDKPLLESIIKDTHIDKWIKKERVQFG